MKLRPQEIKALSEYINENYTLNELDSLILTRAEFKVRNKFSNNDNFETDLPIFINNLSKKNKDFIPFLFALQCNLDDVKIVNKIIFDNGLSLQGYQNKTLEVDQSKSQSALQNLINSNPILDTDVLLNNLARNKRCVCRVEVFSEDGRMIPGTGFLISPNQVLTNYHVVEPVLDKQDLLQEIKCRFDYEKTLDNLEIISGTEYSIAANKPIEVKSKFSDYDVQGEPNLDVHYPENQCDYAVINLKESLGNMPFGINAGSVLKGEERKWVNLNNYNTEDNSNVLILQHPEGQSQKLAIGLNKIIGYSKNRRRIRYDVNTMHGSSGSPLFNEKFELIGVHNMGDPRYVPEFNQGIHINSILSDLNNQNYAVQLCTY